MNLTTATHIHDVIGIGFGPSNMALAIALEELAQTNGKKLNALFLEKQQNYRWHGDTLASESDMQISFLKDLVSLRTPTSPYSFVNYLHQHGRLIDFINLSTFTPCRMEFNDYLRWVSEHFAQQTIWGEEVMRLEPCFNNGAIDCLRLISRDGQGRETSRLTQSLVVSTGGTPRVPAAFAAFGDDFRVFHHSKYLTGVEKLPCSQGKPMRIAVIGSGQSAAEAFINLSDSFPAVNVDMILRSSALKPADDTPFVNEIFAPATTDRTFHQTAEQRERVIAEYQSTNYSVVDPKLIERIYNLLYRQKVARQFRHALHAQHEIQTATATSDGIELNLLDLITAQRRTFSYDAVILATGYDRRSHRDLLLPLEDYLQNYAVGRDYRLLTSPKLKAAIYLQGFCEDTHGLSDTLLSVLPIRSEEIGKAIYRNRAKSAEWKAPVDDAALLNA